MTTTEINKNGSEVGARYSKENLKVPEVREQQIYEQSWILERPLLASLEKRTTVDPGKYPLLELYLQRRREIIGQPPPQTLTHRDAEVHQKERHSLRRLDTKNNSS